MKNKVIKVTKGENKRDSSCVIYVRNYGLTDKSKGTH